MKEKITEAYESLCDNKKIELWNEYCDMTNMYDDRAIPVDELDELFPLDSFNDVRDVIRMFSSIMNDNGVYQCDYASINGYGYLVPFNENDIDEEALIDSISDGDYYINLPTEIEEIIENEDDEEDDF